MAAGQQPQSLKQSQNVITNTVKNAVFGSKQIKDNPLTKGYPLIFLCEHMGDWNTAPTSLLR